MYVVGRTRFELVTNGLKVHITIKHWRGLGQYFGNIFRLWGVESMRFADVYSHENCQISLPLKSYKHAEMSSLMITHSAA